MTIPPHKTEYVVTEENGRYHKLVCKKCGYDYSVSELPGMIHYPTDHPFIEANCPKCHRKNKSFPKPLKVFMDNFRNRRPT